MSKNLKINNGSKSYTYIKSAVIGIAVTFLTMVLLSAVMMFTGIDRAFAVPFATISIAIGAFIASLYASSKIGDRGYLIGLIIGAVFFLIIMLVSLIVNRSGLSYNTLFHFVIIMLASVVGGIMGVNRGKNKKYI